MENLPYSRTILFETMLGFCTINILKFEYAMVTKLRPIKKNGRISDLEQQILTDITQQLPTYLVNHGCQELLNMRFLALYTGFTDQS